jgi:hypothetical protein
LRGSLGASVDPIFILKARTSAVVFEKEKDKNTQLKGNVLFQLERDLILLTGKNGGTRIVLSPPLFRHDIDVFALKLYLSVNAVTINRRVFLPLATKPLLKSSLSLLL